MKLLNFHRLELIYFLLFTLWGVANGQVTVFYLIYLFWFQELIRTIVDLFFIIKQQKTIAERWFSAKNSFGGFFILFIYFVFIVVLFGWMVNFKNSELLATNIGVFVFKNWYFNSTLILFFIEYLYFRTQVDNSNLKIEIFNKRHIILHISIIAGAIIQMILLPKLNIDNQWGNALVVLPFLLLKLFLNSQSDFKTNKI
ncbi:MAG TPA: DUF6498-containing protein [Taishania sp.]|nr:DUF6498-containing protein [Taishania sp.]